MGGNYPSFGIERIFFVNFQESKVYVAFSDYIKFFLVQNASDHAKKAFDFVYDLSRRLFRTLRVILCNKGAVSEIGFLRPEINARNGVNAS